MTALDFALPGSAVAVIQRHGFWVVEAESPLLGKELGLALIKNFVVST